LTRVFRPWVVPIPDPDPQAMPAAGRMPAAGDACRRRCPPQAMLSRISELFFQAISLNGGHVDFCPHLGGLGAVPTREHYHRCRSSRERHNQRDGRFSKRWVGAWSMAQMQAPVAELVNRHESGVAVSPVAPEQDVRWSSRTTRGGADRAALSGSAASPSPLLLGCALQPSAQNDPPAPPQTPDFLPTEAELTEWAVFMFLSGTGAVLPLVLTTTVREATVRLLSRIRAALKPIFDDDENRTKLPPSDSAVLDMEEAGGYLAAAVMGAGLLPSGDAARAVGEIVRLRGDGAKGTTKYEEARPVGDGAEAACAAGWPGSC